MKKTWYLLDINGIAGIRVDLTGCDKECITDIVSESVNPAFLSLLQFSR
jgi:hypothetical protein